MRLLYLKSILMAVWLFLLFFIYARLLSKGKMSGNSRKSGSGRKPGSGRISGNSAASSADRTPGVSNASGGSGSSRKMLRDDIRKLLNTSIKVPQHTDVCAAAKVKKSGINALGIEDRENDWLARQLKEEAELKKKMYSDMAALKQEHIAEHGRIHRGE